MLLRALALSMLLIDSAAAISQAVVQGTPYTVTKKTTHFQKIADGTIITRVETSLDARDSQGRTLHLDDNLTGNGKHFILVDLVAHTTTVGGVHRSKQPGFIYQSVGDLCLQREPRV